MKSSEGDTFAMATPEHVLVKVAGERVFFADIGKVGPNAAISMKPSLTVPVINPIDHFNIIYFFPKFLSILTYITNTFIVF